MILCCGEALIDMIPKPLVGGGEGFAPHTGGSVFNTAIALGRLGADVGLLTGLSTDFFGDMLCDALTESHVDVSSVVRSERPTTLAFVQLIDGQASYAFFDENSAGRMLSPTEMDDLPAATKALFFGGISLVAEPAAEAYAALIARHSTTHLTMLDPNIRPSFIQDETRYRERLASIISCVDIIKVSTEDLDWLSPSQEDAAAKAKWLLEQGPQVVIVTAGENGAVAYRKNEGPICIHAQSVSVADTVGAGDAFNAGFLSRLSAIDLNSIDAFRSISTEDLLQCLEFATRVAAATVTKSGANPPWRYELISEVCR
ncbi:MAG: carbohydrate kinase [Pseudomonadota bacterium]